MVRFELTIERFRKRGSQFSLCDCITNRKQGFLDCFIIPTNQLICLIIHIYKYILLVYTLILLAFHQELQYVYDAQSLLHLAVIFVIYSTHLFLESNSFFNLFYLASCYMYQFDSELSSKIFIQKGSNQST